LKESPLITTYIYTWLDNALDAGITEFDFWNMTIGELERAMASKHRMLKAKAQEQASFDYILAELIGKSISRIYSSAATMPEIAEIYPSLFDSQEIQEKKQEKMIELSTLRFKLFAKSYNDRFVEEAKE
jgi:hypothetical protein